MRRFVAFQQVTSGQFRRSFQFRFLPYLGHVSVYKLIVDAPLFLQDANLIVLLFCSPYPFTESKLPTSVDTMFPFHLEQRIRDISHRVGVLDQQISLPSYIPGRSPSRASTLWYRRISPPLLIRAPGREKNGKRFHSSVSRCPGNTLDAWRPLNALRKTTQQQKKSSAKY